MKLEKLKLEEIRPYENNPRKNDEAVNAVAESIRQPPPEVQLPDGYPGFSEIAG